MAFIYRKIYITSDLVEEAEDNFLDKLIVSIDDFFDITRTCEELRYIAKRYRAISF